MHTRTHKGKKGEKEHREKKKRKLCMKRMLLERRMGEEARGEGHFSRGYESKGRVVTKYRNLTQYTQKRGKLYIDTGSNLLGGGTMATNGESSAKALDKNQRNVIRQKKNWGKLKQVEVQMSKLKPESA